MTLVRRVPAQKCTKQYNFVESWMEFILNPASVTYELDYYLWTSVSSLVKCRHRYPPPYGWW